MHFTSSIGDAIRIPLEIDDVCLVLFSLDVLRLTGAAPTTERSITTEQCPGRRL